MLREFLAMALAYVLDGLDYEEEPRSSQAIAARCGGHDLQCRGCARKRGAAMKPFSRHRFSSAYGWRLRLLDWVKVLVPQDELQRLRRVR